MDKTRFIDRDLLDDDRFATLSTCAWRLFVSMLLLADESGRVRIDSRYLTGAVFWASESADVLAALEELDGKGVIVCDVGESVPYAQIQDWEKYSRPDLSSDADER